MSNLSIPTHLPTVADHLVQCLVEEGVRHVFGYPGGAALPVYDAIARSGRVQHVLVRHEQSAAHAADGYARASGQVGVCLVCSPARRPRMRWARTRSRKSTRSA
jgi:acetolactate synthase-1/2/3 large subunit